MKKWILPAWCAFPAAAILSALPASAKLPMLHDDDWIGYFAVHESNRYDFVMQRTGEIALIPKNRERKWVAVANHIRIDYGIEELHPDGKSVFKETRPGSLVSEHEATDDLDKVVIRGNATGDAVFELVIEQSRDIISIGGRVVDPGELKEHPLRFAVRVSLPNVYRRVDILNGEEQREFDQLTRRDYLELKRLDGSREKLDHENQQALDGQALTGSGVEEIEMRLSYYEGRRFFFEATRNSGMAIGEDRSPGAWYEGMVLHWTTDPAKDTEHKGRLSFWVK
ncbi:MAG: hypothetical protein R3242_07935 [Akkermansiaceae bacterium]|nr:hypothetical protein [Akkermansiaceae bacterium]